MTEVVKARSAKSEMKAEIPRECRRLAEVDFPISTVSKHSVAEKLIRSGHPSAIHLWWARRPLGACRAMILALLLPDPCDENCPQPFKTCARNVLPAIQGSVGESDADIREALLKFVGDCANWELSQNKAYLDVAHALISSCYAEEQPMVVDPFSGGGTVPLEGLRLGCDIFSSDLNPVACLILKVMLEELPRFGERFIEEVRTFGEKAHRSLVKELQQFYPMEPDGGQPITYMWARTIRCESPKCGAEIPLIRSFWLAKKDKRKLALRYQVMKPDDGEAYLQYEIFEPKNEKEVPGGSVSRAKASCFCCSAVLRADRVRAQLSEQRGGADVILDKSGKRIGGATLLAVVSIRRGEEGRKYRLPSAEDYKIFAKVFEKLQAESDESAKSGLSFVPNETLPLMSGTFNAPLYGMTRWGDLYTARQKLALATLAKIVRQMPAAPGIEQAAKQVLGLTVSKLADLSNALCAWQPTVECPVHLFSRQAIGMAWDFAEAVPVSDSSGSFGVTYSRMADALSSARVATDVRARPQIADACSSPLPDGTSHVWFTDPPYYFAVPYADLSDFFFVWLKRALPEHPLMRDPFDPSNPLTPKNAELCEMAHWDSVRYPHKDQLFFEQGMQKAFAEGRRVLRDDGVGCVVFAHKTTEGWEALISGMIRGGWVITSSWPIATERTTRLRARNSAALATSVHLVCRPRAEDAGVGDWADVLRELPKRVSNWMIRLEQEGVRGADLVFACIGPALEIFSQYSRVETADPREVTLPEYLLKVWEVVGRSALEQVLGTREARAGHTDAGVLEEDARLTALFLWTLQTTDGEDNSIAAVDDPDEQVDTDEEDDDEDSESSSKSKGFSLVYDVVRRFAQPLGIRLPDWEGRIIQTKKGVVTLLSVMSRSRQLLGEDGISVFAQLEERAPQDVQLKLNLDFNTTSAGSESSPGRRRRRSPADSTGAEQETSIQADATTLDRVHLAMLLQKAGRSNALRKLLESEKERGTDFLRLANALSALYPRGSEEKRLLDAMLLALPK